MWMREGEKKKEVVCSRARGRALDDASLWKQKDGEESEGDRTRVEGRHAGDRGEREHTHLCNLIRERAAAC